MSARSASVAALKVFLRMIGWFGLIILWEMLTAPAVSHSNSWRGLPISVALLIFGAYRTAKHDGRDNWFFLWGVVASLLFLPRFFGMDRFHLWLQYQAPPTDVIVICWIGVALVLGVLCWSAAQLQRSFIRHAGRDGTNRPEAEPHAPAAEPDAPLAGRLRIAHLLVLTTCTAAYLGLQQEFEAARELSFPEGTRSSAVRMTHEAMGVGAALTGLLLFVVRRMRRTAFPKHPGEFLILALGVAVLANLAFQMAAILSLSEGATYTSSNWRRVFLTTGQLISGIILLLAASRTRYWRWRVVLFWLAAVNALYCLAMSLEFFALLDFLSILSVLGSLLLLCVFLMDLVQRVPYPWTHWFGVATKLWFALAWIGRFN